MDRIGVRELRQHASRYLARVATGETIEVTDRGHPIALLVPVQRDRWRELVASGEVIEADGEGDVLDDPPINYGIEASARLTAMRDDAALSLYLDSSALVRLVAREAESDALRRFLRRHREERRVTCALARVEAVRAVFAGGPSAVAHARRQLGRCDQIAVGTDLLDRASTLAPTLRIRSLDAIHLAAAQLVQLNDDGFGALVTYDRRMADASEALGLAVESPA